MSFSRVADALGWGQCSTHYEAPVPGDGGKYFGSFWRVDPKAQEALMSVPLDQIPWYLACPYHDLPLFLPAGYGSTFLNDAGYSFLQKRLELGL